jgi:hypothetical protein
MICAWPFLNRHLSFWDDLRVAVIKPTFGWQFGWSNHFGMICAWPFLNRHLSFWDDLRVAVLKPTFGMICAWPLLNRHLSSSAHFLLVRPRRELSTAALTVSRSSGSNAFSKAVLLYTLKSSRHVFLFFLLENFLIWSAWMPCFYLLALPSFKPRAITKNCSRFPPKVTARLS